MPAPTRDTVLRRAEVIQRKTQAVREVADRFAKQIFEEILQGDALANSIEEELVAEFEDPHLFETEEGADLLLQIETQYYDLVWHHIMTGLGERMRATLSTPDPRVFPTASRHPSQRPLHRIP